MKFDGDIRDDVAVRQRMIEEERLAKEHLAFGKPKPHYGSLGKPTWGVLQAPSKSVPVDIPGYPGATLREGFNATQKLRAESDWWGRDEPHFMAKAGFQQPPLLINEASVTCP